MSKFRQYILIFSWLIGGIGSAQAGNISALAQSEAWLKLLHYHKTISGSYEGLVHNAAFYVAPDGRDNPEAEMAAEIKAFAAGEAKCAFPARFNWLKEHNLLTGDLSDCDEYQAFIKDIRPNGITLLFTNAYMGNPASLFGHTLIRIDTARKGTQMLAHGSNFGANSGTDQGIPFIVKGLFGGYDGKYSLSPYWTVINTYNNIENRDIWEYKLNLNETEQQKFVDHLYEMKDAEIQYFFLIKNCSYMILELLEAVRPELELTDDYRWWAIPLDTLKTIKNVPDLVGEVNYRPARYTKIMAQLKAMSPEQYAAFLAEIKDEKADEEGLSDDEKAVVLETAYQYYQYKYIAKDMALAEYRKKSFAVLRARSRLPEAKEVEIAGEDPSLAHDSALIAVGYGADRKRRFEEIIVRPAYTTLIDDNFGMIRGAGVKVMESRWRYYNRQHRLVLQDLTGLEIRSLLPANRVFQPISYATDLSLKREYNPQTLDEGYAAYMAFAVGKTWAVSDYFRLYGLMRGAAEYGGFLPHNQWVAAVPEVGFFSDLGRVRLHASAAHQFATQIFADRTQYKAEAAFSLNKNVNIVVEYEAERNRRGHNRTTLQTMLQFMF